MFALNILLLNLKFERLISFKNKLLIGNPKLKFNFVWTKLLSIILHKVDPIIGSILIAIFSKCILFKLYKLELKDVSIGKLKLTPNINLSILIWG